MTTNNIKLRHVFQTCDGSVRPLASLDAAPHLIRQMHPGGVNHILIGLSQVQRMGMTPSPPAIIAILIGLLLPAVQKITDGTSNTLRGLESALKPGGGIWYVMGDGSVRNATNLDKQMPNGLIGLL